MSSSFDHRVIDAKWQARWEADRVFEVEDFAPNPFYCLVEFPYPSGEGLHVGHPKSYTAIDILARKRRREGFSVLYPMGFDAFGLPAENFAIKQGIHPAITTAKNIDRFRKQLKSMGFSFDWSREVITADPSYYKWTQWIFLQFYKAGLAYKAKAAINWCPSCKIGLANEEVVGGQCERCGSPVEVREKEQWMLKITAYAQRLLQDLDTVDYLPKIKSQMAHWIGKSTGARLRFEMEGQKEKIEVFTTRPDTLFGVTYLVLAPEHPLVDRITTPEQHEAVQKYRETAKRKSFFERTENLKEKTGEWTGAFAHHPFTGERLPVWIADYVVMNYGTGAVMAVPAHDQRDFEFATLYHLPICQVVEGGSPRCEAGDIETEAWTEDGRLIHSEFLDGLTVVEATIKIISWLEENQKGKAETTYHLRDWVFSRQHYWGEPIPMIHCKACGWVPVPEDQLPVELPHVDRYQPTETGESPLSVMTEWVNVACPKCGGPAQRETDTMPNWAGSSWYFLRYIDPKNSKALADPKKLEHWLPVDIYNGGMEHTTLHLLYSRFWNKFLFDRGVVPVSEPYRHRHSHGMILGEGGVKMSKSKGNVVNPDEVIKRFGADTLRLYLMFLGPFEETTPWSEQGIVGCHRFLDKVEGWVRSCTVDGDEQDTETLHHLNQTIKKVSSDIEGFRFNTAISQMMIFINTMIDKPGGHKKTAEGFLQLLNPFAPHLTEELWENLGHSNLLCKEPWPVADTRFLKSKLMNIVVQVNGKRRAVLEMDAAASEETIKSRALEERPVQAALNGAEIRKVIVVPGKLINLVL